MRRSVNTLELDMHHVPWEENPSLSTGQEPRTWKLKCKRLWPGQLRGSWDSGGGKIGRGTPGKALIENLYPAFVPTLSTVGPHVR